MSEHKNIYEALHAAYKNTGYVQKTGKMEFGNTKYKYAGESDLIEAVRPALLDNDIIFYCIDICEKERETIVEKKYDNYNKRDKEVNTFVYSAMYTFVFHHIKSDTKIEVKAMGKGIDTGDKSEYKAATGALKYALRQTFVIETGDDPDKQSSEEQETTKKPISYSKPKDVAIPDENVKLWRDAYENLNKLVIDEESLIAWEGTYRNILSQVKKPNNKEKHEVMTSQLYYEKVKQYQMDDEIPM